MERVLELVGLKDTKELAKALVDLVAPSRVMLLSGDLGAGKTTFTRYLCEEMGIDPDQVASPTFSIIHEYESPGIPVAHVDLYRLGPGTEVLDIGLDEYLDRGFFIIIEWSEYMEGPFCDNPIRLEFRLLESDRRQVRLNVPDDFLKGLKLKL